MEVRREARYQYTSAAPKDWTQELPDLREIEKQKVKPAARKAEKTAVPYRETPVFFTVLFTAVAIATMIGVLVQYLGLQANIHTSLNSLAEKENYLSELRLENDEKLNTAETAIDLEEVKRIAIEELGMRYATEDQFVLYGGQLRNYVVQYENLP